MKTTTNHFSGDVPTARVAAPPMFWAWMSLAVLVTFIVYLPVLNHPFVNLDDPFYVKLNPLIRRLDLSTIRLMLTDISQSTFWMPLTWLSLGVDYAFVKLDPELYFMHNLMLHCANTALVYLVSFRIVGLAHKSASTADENQPTRFMAASFFAALLFALHPLHVESVAWATERKDVLYGLFFLASVLAYLSHCERPRAWKYGLSFTCFLAAVAAKPMAITLPLVLMLLDVWPIGKWTGRFADVLKNKIPFLLVSLASVSATLLFHYGNKNLVVDAPLSFRLMNAAHSLMFYLAKMIAPRHLRAFYPADPNKTYSLEYILAAIAVVYLFAMVVVFRKKRPAIAVAWFYYFLTLAPVLGFVQSGVQSSADRFTYLPSLGPMILFAAVFVDGLYKRRLLLVVLVAGILSGLTWGSHKQIDMWKDSVSLWMNVLSIQPKNSPFAYAASAEAHKDAGALDFANVEIELAIKIDPENPGHYALRGELRLKKGLVDEAIRDFRTSIALIRPGAFDPIGHYPHWHLALAYIQKGTYKEAIAESQAAIQMKPDDPGAYNALGLAFAGLKRYPESIEAFQKSLSLEPYKYNPVTLRNLRETCIKSVNVKTTSPKSTPRGTAK